jgi:hypothetical protein
MALAPLKASELPDAISRSVPEPPLMVIVTEVEAVSVTVALLVRTNRAIVSVGTLVMVGEGVEDPSIRKMSFDAGVVLVGVQFVAVVHGADPV